MSSNSTEDRKISSDAVVDAIPINEEVALPSHLAADHHDVAIVFYDESDTECIRAKNLKKFLIARCKPGTKVLLKDDPYFVDVTGKIEVMGMMHSMCTLFFLLLSPEFCKDEFFKMITDTYLMISLKEEDKRWSVIPLRTEKLEYKTPFALNSLTGIDIEKEMIGVHEDIFDEKFNVDAITPSPLFEKRVCQVIEDSKPKRYERQKELEKERKEYKKKVRDQRRQNAQAEKAEKEKYQKLTPVTPTEVPEPELDRNDKDDKPFITINVEPVDTMCLLSHLIDKDVYSVTHKFRGRAVIISNEKFVNPDDNRAGSDVDRQNLEGLLVGLDFVTESHCNKTAKDMVDIIAKESRREEHAEADSFILALLSHGTQGAVKGTDGKEVSIEETIKKAFDGIHCPALAGKPKLIIIQACRGGEKTKGVPIKADAIPDEEKEEDLSLLGALKRLKIRDEDLPGASGVVTGTSVTHEKSDMCVAYASVPGFAAYRHKDKGTWFIRTLVKVFMQYAKTKHVYELLRKVRLEVCTLSEEEAKSSGAKYLQMTQNDDTLKKNWYLLPGYKPQQ